MLDIKIPYSPGKSNIFGTILRPLVPIKIYSKTKNTWIPVYDTLADTGADITLLPRYLGEMVVNDITSGMYVEIKGIVPKCCFDWIYSQHKIRSISQRI